MNSNIMDDTMEAKVVYVHQSVLLKPPNACDDDYCNGSLSIVENDSGTFIEWKPSDVSDTTDEQENDWSMVTTTSHRIRTLSTNSVSGSDLKTQPIRFALSQLMSYRVNKKQRYIELTLKNGTSYNAFHFTYDSPKGFVAELCNQMTVRRSALDHTLYIVSEKKSELESLATSFTELNLYTENQSHVVWNFMSNLKHRPIETTMETFSKFSDAFLGAQEPRPVEVQDLITSLSSNETSNRLVNEESYQIVLRLAPRPDVTRGKALTFDDWYPLLDADGRLSNPKLVKQIIFRGGVAPECRSVVWKFLLGYYPWDSTTAQQEKLKKDKSDIYYQMKRQWLTISPDQESRFSSFNDRKCLIEKDVNRTDRNHSYYSGDHNKNLEMLNDVLMTYVMYNFDLGYVQGMSDLLSPILMLFTNEVEAFWCFVGVMDKLHKYFEMCQEPMKAQLANLYTLVGAAEPDLALHLDRHDSSNMFFCFRWLLVIFKREFSFNDIFRLWDVIFSGLPCSNFHLLICVAILAEEKDYMIQNDFGFTQILKHINDLSMRINVDDAIKKAEAIYLQLANSTGLPTSVKQILGLVDNDSHSEARVLHVANDKT